MQFHADHMAWIVNHMSPPETGLIAQIPIVLAGAFYDARGTGLPPERFFPLVRQCLAPLNRLASGNEEVEMALTRAPLGHNRAETEVLATLADRIPETLSTARSAGVRPMSWLQLWREVVERFERTIGQ